MTLERLFFALLVFTPLAVVGEYLAWPPLAVFILSALAIVPLAKYIGSATEDLALRTTPAVGGLLNATFGNATEFIVGIFALQAGLVEVVKASITGSIIGNLLFVLGMAIFAGGLSRTRQTFNATAAKAQGSMLLLATLALVIPAIFLFTSSGNSALRVEHLSVLVAVIMIIAYAANLVFTLRTHKHLYSAESESVFEPVHGVAVSVAILAASTLAVAVASEALVSAIRPVVAGFGWTELFIGAVVVAIVGNAAEHLSAVTAAMKNHMDLAFQISIGSATQVVMFVAPALVLASLFFPTPMSLVFNLFELVAIIFAVFVANAVVEDGESNWFEGFQLLVAYLILAVAFFFHP